MRLVARACIAEGNPEPFKRVSQRCCTDICCLVVFLAYVIAMLAVGVFSLQRWEDAHAARALSRHPPFSVPLVQSLDRSTPLRPRAFARSGNLDFLLYPVDYTDQFCGKTDGVSNRTKAFFPRLDQDLAEQALIIASPGGFINFQPYTLCVEECPKAFSITNPAFFGGADYPGAAADAKSFYATSQTQELFSRCLPITTQIPADARTLCTIPACGDASLSSIGAEANCVAINAQPTVTTAWEVTSSAGAALCSYSTKEQVQATFYPTDATPETRASEKQFASYISSAFSVLKSVTDNWVQIVAMGIGAPFALALVWFVFLYCFAGIIIAIALTVLFLLLVAVTLFLFYKAGFTPEAIVDNLQNFTAPTTISLVPEDEGGIGQTWYAVLGVISAILCVVYLILMVLWRNAINRCIAIVREVTKVIFALPFMITWPIVGFSFHALIGVYLCVVGGLLLTSQHTSFSEVNAAIQLASNGTATAPEALSAFTNLDGAVQIAILFIIHIVGIIWAYWVTELAVYTTLARTCAVWYYSHGQNEAGDTVQKASFHGCGLMVVLTSAWCIFSRHLGSVALAGAILTIFTVIRMILEGFAYVAKQKNPDNAMLKMAIKCTQCCLWCLEKTVQMVTYFGMIFVAIEGQTYCKACWSTFKCWSHYPAQVAVNKMVSNVLALVISLTIPVACGFLGYLWVEALGGHEPIWAAIFIGICSWVIATCVTDVFKCAIDTIFICVFTDLEHKDGPQHMSAALQKGFDVDTAKMQKDRRATIQITKTDAGSEKGAAVGDVELSRP